MHLKHVPQDYGRSILPKDHVAEQILQVEVAVQLLLIFMAYPTTKYVEKLLDTNLDLPVDSTHLEYLETALKVPIWKELVLHMKKNRRKHIWSFANALLETGLYGNGKHVCPCSDSRITMQQFIPTFVGTDYFCEAGIQTFGRVGVFYDSYPLWDGAGCESPSTCCSFNNPPWFYTQLTNTTNDDVEMRICADEEATRNEDSPVELVEIYIQ